MSKRASGTFEVKMTPMSPDEIGDPGVRRMVLEKQFHGDLEGTSKGQMLAVSTDIEGSAGYVAIERVSGTLNSQNGTFVLQHFGTMNRGTFELNISVIPDSGTEQLTGLKGEMVIKITDGNHFYEFEYSLVP